MAGIVLIEGDKGVATGFIANVHDTVCVVTNLHVLGENEKFTIRNLEGEVVGVSVQGIIGAVGADIALLRLADPTTAPPALEMAENVLQAAKIGDEVVVVGNRLGGGVATQTTGKIKGVGPSRVEVDAPFQPGNSGSPIFDRASSQVVGVAAYAETVPLDALGNPAKSSATALKRETRWFGYRLDSVTKWEGIEWPKWRSQITQVTAYREASLALLALLQGNFVAAKEDAKLKRIVEQYQAANAPRGSAAQAVAVRTMLGQARAYAHDTADDLTGNFYDYFQSSLYWETSVPEQTKFRDLLLKAFAEVDSNLQTAQRGGGG
jgi:serine protease Do